MTQTDLQSFFEELRAVIKAGVRLGIGADDGKPVQLNLANLEQLERKVSSGEELPERFQAAIETFRITDSMIPVLEGLSTRLNAWNRIGRMFRRAQLYIFTIAFVSIGAMIYQQLYVLPNIEAVREDVIKLANPAIPISDSNIVLISKIAAGVLVGLLLILIWWLFKGGVAKAGWLGGASFSRFQSMAAAARTMQLLVSENIEPVKAAQLAGTLAGLDEVGQGELLYSIKDLDAQSTLSPAWSDYLLMIADQQFIKTRIWGPTTLTVVIGSIFAIVFVLLAYWPIASLIQDLSHSTRL